MIGKVWSLQIVCIITILSNSFAGETFSATVMKIIDGDSMLIATAEETLEVRLYGVDCPEYDQPFSQDAKRLAREIALRQKVVVEPVYHDSYGRLVAVVARPENSLNRALVQAGLAWVSPRYCRKSFCSAWKENESTARKERRGLWRDDHPDPPWRWKKMKKGR